MIKQFKILALLALMSNGQVFSQEIQNGRSNNASPLEVPVVEVIESIVETPTSIQDVSNDANAVYNESLYVIGKLGLGYGMTNNYSFGMNSIVVKENNIRVFFNDDSSVSTFPDNDWSIDINETVNGGAEYFAVSDATAATTPFKIMAGAASNAFYLKSNGYVGFGTSNPVTELHSSDGDTPTLRLDQDGTSGWATQVWDVAGNEANFFIRDVTHTNNLVFRIQPAAPANALTIKSTGNIGIGSWNPTEKLDVFGNVKLSGFLRINPLVYDTTATPIEGDLYMNSEDHNLSFYNGTEWMKWSDHQNLELSSHLLSLTNDSTAVDLSLYMDNTDSQVLNLSSNELSISGSLGTIDLSSFLDNTDAQELSLSSNNLILTGGANIIDLSPFMDNTDNQSLALNENILSIDNGNTVDLSSFLDNTDAQDLSLSSNNLSISGGSAIIDLTSFMDNTDQQSLNLDGNVLSIENGNSVELNAYLDNSDEQDLVSASLTGSLLEVEIENGSSVTVDLYPLISDLEERIANLESIVTGVASPTYSHAKLFNNTPNPFSNETLIPFFIPETANNASILITNVQGIEVNVIPVEQRTSGSIVITGADINSGAYFYSLIIDDHIVDTKTLIKQ